MISAKAQDASEKFQVPALAKGLDILETLAFALEPQSLTDLARTLGRSKNEIFRMLGYLEARGYIVKEERSGNYYLSLKLYELAHTHTPMEQLLKVATRPMEELARELAQTCTLNVLHHYHVIAVAQALSPRRVRLSFDLGRPFSVVYSVSGRLLLAQFSEDDQTAFLDRVPDYQALDKMEQKAYKAKLHDIQEKGYAFAVSEWYEGVEDISVLVGNANAGLMAALTVPGFKSTQRPWDFDKILDASQQCANRIIEAVGLTPGSPVFSQVG
ncbi:MAG TPA: IclR family transcriptional regulator [Anaerolineae bacterium]|nr:IclR family transcriptional regulator [Anaerolineae bacterium]MCB9106511.1 IclR family transcriptional regulator [Anaerolineales bacterium]HRV96420.1 IclR family transcriptional regulator [Anaerolineae bacterium]